MAAVTITPATYTGSKSRVGRSSKVGIGAVSGGSGTGETFLEIEELMEATPSGSAWEIVDATNFQSGSDKEKKATIRDNGKVTLKGNLISPPPTGQAALFAAYNAGVPYDFVIQLAKGPGQTTSGDQYAFSGIVLSFVDFPVGVTSLVQFTATIEVTGAYAITAGS